MAKAARIDDIIFNPDGTVNVLKSEGDAPLPLAPMGMGTVYASKADLFAEALALEEELLNSGKLALIQIAAGIKKDPNMGANFVSQTKGKTTVLDLTGATVPIVVG